MFNNLLFDIKSRTLGYAFYQPPQKSLPNSVYPKKICQKISNPKVINIPPPPPPPRGSQGLCIMFLGKTPYSDSASPPRSIRITDWNELVFTFYL